MKHSSKKMGIFLPSLVPVVLVSLVIQEKTNNTQTFYILKSCLHLSFEDFQILNISKVTELSAWCRLKSQELTINFYHILLIFSKFMKNLILAPVYRILLFIFFKN